jgi:hypothetical protein
VLTEQWDSVVDHDDKGHPVTQADLEDISSFLSALAQHMGLPTSTAPTMNIPTELDGIILIADDQAVRQLAERLRRPIHEILRHTLLFNARNPVRTLPLLESSNAIGAIEVRRYWVWRAHRDDDPGGGVIGRKDVARHMGASWHSPGLWETENYCWLLAQPAHPTLPEATAAYMTYFAEVFPDALW